MDSGENKKNIISDSGLKSIHLHLFIRLKLFNKIWNALRIFFNFFISFRIARTINNTKNKCIHTEKKI